MFADIIVDDRNGKPVAIVEMRITTIPRDDLDEDPRPLAETLDPSITYSFVVDLATIHLFKRNANDETFVPIVELNTKEVLGHYAPEFAGTESRYVNTPIFQDFVETLVEGWLRDLAYHWKSVDPPGSKALEHTGLLERIADGMTRTTERAAGGPSLP